MSLLYPLPRRTTVRALASNYTRGRVKAIRLLVIHDGETGEGSGAAEGMGNWFADPRAQGSAHAGFDTDSVCTYIADGDTAWGAKGANADGLHGELAGRAGQTSSQWKDAASLRILENGAVWFAEKALRHGIPARYLTDAQLADGRTKGITLHRQCSRVFGGSHTDPGASFPADYFLSRIRFHIARLTPAPVKPAPVPPATPTPITPEEPTMLVKAANHPAEFVTNGITRRWLPNQAARDRYNAARKAFGLPVAKAFVGGATDAELTAAFGPIAGTVPAGVK